MKNQLRVIGILFNLALFLSVSTTARADGLIDGMADGINDSYTYVSKVFEELGDHLEQNVTPSVKNIGKQVQRSAIDILDGVTHVTNNLKQDLGAESKK
jgi:hypothetical protein